MSLEEEIAELSTVYHGQRAYVLEQLVREYYALVEQGYHLAFPAEEKSWKERVQALQQRAKSLLENKV